MKKYKNIPWLLIAIFLFGVISSLLFKAYREKKNELPYEIDGNINILIAEPWLFFDLPGGSHGDETAIAYISNRNNLDYAMFIYRYPEITDSFAALTTWTEFSGYKEKSTLSGEYLYQTDQLLGLIREFKYQVQTTFGTKNRHCTNWYVIANQTGYVISQCASEGNWEKIKPDFQILLNNIQLSGQE